MFSPTDTIVAIATPPGRGGIGVVRVSGPQAAGIAATLLRRREPLLPRHATLARVFERANGAGRAIDEVVATYFPAPASYTGEDVVEISGHGSPVLLRAIVSAALAAGARFAEPGEFTLRAFVNGRMDLVQAEAVRDLIDAVTPQQARAAFDQLELVERAIEAMRRARTAAAAARPEEFVLADLQQAHEVLQEITGTRTSEDVLRHIFEKFCIGK